MKKKLKKYQSTGEVKGSQAAKKSQIIAGISGAVAGAAGIGKNIADRIKAKKSTKAAQIREDNRRKVENENRNSTLQEMEDAGTGYNKRKGGAVSKKKLPRAKYGRGVVSTSDGTYTRAGKKIGSGIGKSAEYRDFTTGTGDRSTKSISEKVKLRKSNKKASDSGNIQIAKKGGAVHKMPNGKMMKGRTHKKK